MPLTDPEQDAGQVLEQAWRPLDDPGALPVDPVRIARSLGMEVYAAVLPSGESGMLVGAPDTDPVIYINERDGAPRQRFTCAHEIGHYVGRVGAGDTSFRFRDKRDQLSSEGTDPDEVYANRFAAALLMPAPAVGREHAKTRNPALLASRFGVSAAAMTIRLEVLGLR